MKQHYFIDLEKTWDDARQYCRNYFYDLSTFTNETENQQFLEDTTVQTFVNWIGLHKESGIWKWTGGENATQTIYDFYAEATKGNCGFFIGLTLQFLYSRECSYNAPFFCMRVFEIVVVQQTETWETALDYCRDHYDDLASLSSIRSMDYALGKTTEAQTQYVWIGLRFLAGQWFWVSGDDFKYKAWSAAGELQCPARNQRCGALDTSTKIWTPRDCQEKLNFLCFSLP
nr:secretory phospholipase A2 receptor-like [Misgurnus anguillicaudatus]